MLSKEYYCGSEHTSSVSTIHQFEQSSTREIAFGVAQSPRQPTKIPQLTVVQNLTRPVSSAQTSTLRLSQVVRQPPPQSYLRQLSDLHEAKLAKQPPIADFEDNIKEGTFEDEAEAHFDIGGVNLRDEETMLGKVEAYVRTRPCVQTLLFDLDKMRTPLIKICKEASLSLNPETCEKILSQLCYALEIKLRQILQRATLQVHHRLKHFDLKGKRYNIANIERQYEFFEDVLALRESKKAKTKMKGEGADAKKGMKPDDISGRTVQAFSASCRGGRKVENVTTLSNDLKGGQSNIPLHQRLRYSAMNQRRIYLRDLLQIFENEKGLIRSFAIENAYL